MAWIITPARVAGAGDAHPPGLIDSSRLTQINDGAERRGEHPRLAHLRLAATDSGMPASRRLPIKDAPAAFRYRPHQQKFEAMTLRNFSDLLQAARQQPEPQRLLLVFAAAELPRDATAEEKARFERGEGGALTPRLCVDKAPNEIESFAGLLEESSNTDVDWDILFVAALPGRGGFAPSPDEAAQPLRMMVEAIQSGRIGEFLAVSRQGELVALERQ